jgi:hypothetical protein
MRLLVLATVLAGGCYHYSFEHRTRQPGEATVVYQRRAPTYLNGFVDTGKMDTKAYCRDPIRTELRVTATDVLLSVATLLIYTPHTLYVTCPAPEAIAARPGSR